MKTSSFNNKITHTRTCSLKLVFMSLLYTNLRSFACLPPLIFTSNSHATLLEYQVMPFNSNHKYTHTIFSNILLYRRFYSLNGALWHGTKQVGARPVTRPTTTTDTVRLFATQHRAADALCSSCGRREDLQLLSGAPPPNANAFHFC
jgi:hypothetical protein